jgi:large subunit ribosomal protein L9
VIVARSESEIQDYLREQKTEESATEPLAESA